MWSSVKNYVLTLNIFGPSDSIDEDEREEHNRWNIIATRLYLVVFFIVLIVVAAVSWLSTELVVIAIRNPSKQEFQQLPYDAQCPCSRDTISYKGFTSLEPTFHQVCSSDFVSDRWIEAISSGSNATYFDRADFRRIGSGQLQALASFCRLVISNIQQTLSTLELTTLISLNVLSATLLEQETKAAMEQFISIERKRFGAQLALILQMTVANRLVSGLQTNHVFYYNLDGTRLLSIGIASQIILQNNNITCDCLVSPDCKSNAILSGLLRESGQNDQTAFVLPGIAAGCLPVNSMLYSTLECFYNQTCVDIILSFFATKERFSAMKPSHGGIFNPMSTVQSMVDQLMVEDWNINVSYEKYYDQCAPASCTYSLVRRKGFIVALIKVISFMATLAFLLDIIIPNLVSFIRSRLHPSPPRRIKLSDQLQLLMKNIVKLFAELNMFKKRRTNDRSIRYQLYATRLYIISLTVSLIILSVYTFLREVTYRQTVLNPSESQYLHLEQTYPNTLSCPCTHINMSYSTFINSEPHYHQVCSSDLVTQKWLDYSLSARGNPGYIYDYRINAAVQFKTLTFLCNFAEQTVSDALDTLFRTELVGAQVIQRELFETQMNSLVKEWHATTLNHFVRAIQLIRNTTHSNQLLNRLNIYLFCNNDPINVTIQPRDYRGCPCAFTRTCRADMSFFSNSANMTAERSIYEIPNFFVGCYLVDALFMSTLECFYNETCMFGIDQYLNSSIRLSISLPALNATLNSPTETVEAIVNRLMLDSWSSHVNFSSYYQTCAPSECTFDYRSRNDIFSTISTIFGIFGGLSLGYRLIILIGLRMIEKLINGLFVVDLMQRRRRLISWESDEKKIYWLHIVLVIIILSVLYGRITLTPKRMTIETEKPSFLDYQQWNERYSGAVQCSCSRISIKYDAFLKLQARFHSICNNGFISNYWYFLWSNGPLIYNLASRNYVYSGSGQVLAIISFCDLSRQVITDSFRQLLSNDFISTQLLAFDLLNQRMRKMIDDFLITIPKSTINTLSLIRQTTSANMIMNTLSNNWIFTIDNLQQYGLARTKPVIYPECTCGLSAQCTDSVFGVRYGCYVIEALWQSTFEAFYDSRHLGLNLSFPTLNITTNPTRFGINATIGSIVEELMVEEFSSSISYENYFDACAPSLCISSYIEKSHVLEGITVLISLYGGLVIICRLIAVMLVKLFRSQQSIIHPVIQ